MVFKHFPPGFSKACETHPNGNFQEKKQKRSATK